MLGWAKQQLGTVREAMRSGVAFDEAWRRRDAATADAAALGADLRAFRQAAWDTKPVTTLATKYGTLHLRPADTDMLIVRQVLIDREYDFSGLAQMTRVRAAYQAMLDRGDVPVIVDAGANIGIASIWFAHEFPMARIVAVEPDPDNARMARLNVAQLPAVSVLEAAIGGERGVVRIDTPENGSWGGRTERAEDGIRVVTIPDAVAEVPNGRLLIAKIDIEGFESDLFATNTGWAADAAAVIIEPHDFMMPGAGTSRSFQTVMMAQGCELLIVGENLVFVR